MDLKKNNLYRLDFHPKRIKYRFLAQGFNLRFVSCSVSMQWMIVEKKKKNVKRMNWPPWITLQVTWKTNSMKKSVLREVTDRHKVVEGLGTI